MTDVKSNENILQQMEIDLVKDTHVAFELKTILSNLFRVIFSPKTFASVMVPHHGVHLLDAAKKVNSGLQVYAMTNYNGEAYDELKNRYPDIISKFTDIMVSGKENVMKPNPIIYSNAIEKWNLSDKKVLYIDDEWDNINAASKIGWETIHYGSFKDGYKKLLSFLQ